MIQCKADMILKGATFLRAAELSVLVKRARTPISQVLTPRYMNLQKTG